VEYSIEFGGDPQDVTITCSGRADIDGIKRLNEQLVSDFRFRPGMAMLVDSSALDTGRFSDGEMQEMTERVLERDWEFPPRAIAVVLPAPLTRELDRKWTTFVEVVDVLGSRRRMFGTRHEAVAWLRELKSAHT
jgi:hypothetical protein